MRDILGIEFSRVLERGQGHNGWKRSFEFTGTNVIFAIGGQRGTALLQLPGQACALISKEKWEKLVCLLELVYSAKITRWDGAADDYQGIHSVDWAIDQFHAGGFSTGGNKPSINNAGDWTSEKDKKGRTVYFGKRENGKLLRVYEKGKQLGDPTSPWVRWELELHNKDRVIPWDVVTNSGPYVAGAYAATNWISEEANKIKTFQKTALIGYKTLIEHLRNAYSPMINVMNAVEGKPKRLDIAIPPELLEHQATKKTLGK